MPAGQKVCGFLGHSASLDCNKCFKKFPGSVGSKDYQVLTEKTQESGKSEQMKFIALMFVRFNKQKQKLNEIS